MKLRSDNPEQMPITDAVYGDKPRRKKPEQEYAPRGHAAVLWRALPLGVMDDLANRFGGQARRMAARRRQTD